MHKGAAQKRQVELPLVAHVPVLSDPIPRADATLPDK